MKSYDVTIQMKALCLYFHMVEICLWLHLAVKGLIELHVACKK